MEFLTVEQIISIVLSFLSLLFAVFLLTAKTKNYVSNVIISLFLIVYAQDSNGLFTSYFLYPNYPGWLLIVRTTIFLNMPLIYLYILSVIYSDFKLKKSHLLHLLPFVLCVIIFIPRFYAVGYDAKLEFLNANKIDGMPEMKLSYILLSLQILVYIIMSFHAIKTYKSLLHENYSNAILFNYNWLFSLITIITIQALVATLKNVFLFIDFKQAFNYMQLITEILGLGFICWMVLKALHSPELFRGVNSNLLLVKNLFAENQDNNILSKREIDEQDIIRALKEYMNENEPYLDASLTMNNLSEQINIPVKELSLLINHSLNQHFFDFVNGYRIRKAMEILHNKDKKQLTVLEILYNVGFNSKSSFNTEFKKYTKLTPTQFRERAIKSVA